MIVVKRRNAIAGIARFTAGPAVFSAAVAASQVIDSAREGSRIVFRRWSSVRGGKKKKNRFSGI